MTDCKLCIERGKTWDGSDPKCAFITGIFDGSGWNCATANAIRDIIEEQELAVYQDDQYYASIPISNIIDGEECLWVSWYKNRGRTEAMWLLNHYSKPREPREEEVELIINAYKK